MINYNDKINLFSFLKDNNALRQYVRNLLNLSKENPKEFFEKNDLNDAIVGAFVWSQTPEGVDFWGALDKSWVEHINPKNEA